MRGGTIKNSADYFVYRISIHPPRAGRDVQTGDFGSYKEISIHPPRAGRDKLINCRIWLFFDFNPPAPCGAGPRRGDGEMDGCRFQSTRPVRGGTRVLVIAKHIVRFQSTRPVRGGTHRQSSAVVVLKISIHPPRAGRDSVIPYKRYFIDISIHPPRAGRDQAIPVTVDCDP